MFVGFTSYYDNTPIYVRANEIVSIHINGDNGATMLETRKDFDRYFLVLESPDRAAKLLNDALKEVPLYGC